MLKLCKFTSNSKIRVC